MQLNVSSFGQMPIKRVGAAARPLFLLSVLKIVQRAEALVRFLFLFEFRLPQRGAASDMIPVPVNTKVWLAAGGTDMRKDYPQLPPDWRAKSRLFGLDQWHDTA